MFKIVKSIRKRYRWALITIALLISISALLMQYFFSVQKYDSKIINIAGKQRMLSQKIAWHSNALLSLSANSSTHIQSLELSLTQFKSGHNYLLSLNENGEYLYLTPELISLYKSGPGNLDSEVIDYIQEAEKLLYQKGQIEPRVFSVVYVEMLLKRLDYAVSLFEHQALKKVNLVSNLELLLWLIAILLLIVELRFVFMPMELEIFNTLTNYKKQKEFAQQVSKNKEHFIARASHEFRTPLQGLITSIEELDISESQQSIKTQSMYCALRLISMLDELQDLQALSLGRWSLKAKKENLLNSLKKVLIPYEYGCREKGLKLMSSLDVSLDLRIKLDHLRLQQVLTELISNALKFTEQGEITVLATLCDNQLSLIIKDTGCGFTKAIDELELNSFKQSNYFQGLRTGLTRVQYIVKALHGDIEFTNNHPHGALVTLKIPVEPQRFEKLTNVQLPAQLNCLVAEDNPLNMLVLTRILASLGYSYECAEHGKIACEMAAKKQYDIVFMDLNMPIMDGFEASKIIRSLNKKIPIVVVTANTSEDDMAYAYKCGASEHLHKPINEQTIISVLERVYEKSEL